MERIPWTAVAVKPIDSATQCLLFACLDERYHDGYIEFVIPKSELGCGTI
jgi:hypothetical protein